jgi:peptide/nickel transport system substrate-binding protein
MPPYGNNDVRLGLKYAIDREQMVKHVLRGYGDVGNDHPISKINRYYNSDLPQRKYDPDKARYHLKKAGMLDHTFIHHTAETAFPQAVDASVLFSKSAEKAGIKIKVQRVPSDGYWEVDWDNSWSYWSGRPTEDWMFSMVYAAEAPWNDTVWKHDRFNKLLKGARAELDESKRKEMYWEMQHIVRDEGATIIPIYSWFIYPARDKLAFENVASNLELDGLRIAERWWFKS